MKLPTPKLTTEQLFFLSSLPERIRELNKQELQDLLASLYREYMLADNFRRIAAADYLNIPREVVAKFLDVSVSSIPDNLGTDKLLDKTNQ